ncbi:type II toxin-antitoxin system VapC family toxin [Waterburya agarophytonicola K14]|uniref:Type II toxin-antitoxin system VapC family toxin n=1 Tax=Waterburya agarophytonicola KI4 TaxID=2874699 RepID=A0A964BMZ4_9CYAN|nr:type II toxin-antitoxin system VapC family toxin [Waterburya agarophytonicola KI4]
MTQYLLDTHALIWWLANDLSLTTEAKTKIADPNNIVFVSAASTWEIAIKKSIGKLKSPDDFLEQIEQNNFKPLPIKIEETLIIEKLPKHHLDPFDRILIAQAKFLNLTIITRDRKFILYDVDLLKC